MTRAGRSLSAIRGIDCQSPEFAKVLGVREGSGLANLASRKTPKTRGLDVGRFYVSQDSDSTYGRQEAKTARALNAHDILREALLSVERLTLCGSYAPVSLPLGFTWNNYPRL